MVSNFFSLCRPKISCNSIKNKNVYDANKDNHCKQRVHNIQLLFNCTSNEYMAVSKVSKLVEEEKLFRFDQRITSSRCCKYLNICINLQNVLQKNVLHFLQNEFLHSIFFRNFFSMYL